MNTRQSICVLLVACMVMAVAPGMAAAAPAYQSGCIATHVVQPGENLFRISLKYNVTMAAIMQANGIANPNYVYVGQALCIPGGPVAPPPAPPPAPPATGKTYIVQAGDTLAAIAARFGTTVYAIMQANRIVNANYIYVGQCLIIPGSACCAPQPAPQPSGNWKGEYYNNPHLAGSATLVRYDASINFEWGDGSPSSKIPVDNFSVRWTRTVYLKAGTYRFTITVDDGARLWVNDQLVIDQWGQHTASTFTADVDLVTGYHSIRMEHQELTGVATAILVWVKVAEGGGVGAQPSGAWLGQYYDNPDLGGTPIQRFDPAINFDWGDGSPFPGQINDNLFSARWTSTQLFESGVYRFYAIVDDGVRIFVDGIVVMNEWHDSSHKTMIADAGLTAGVHEVKVEYYEFGYQANIIVWWEKIK
jgi:LysM repeat protein